MFFILQDYSNSIKLIVYILFNTSFKPLATFTIQDLIKYVYTLKTKKRIFVFGYMKDKQKFVMETQKKKIFWIYTQNTNFFWKK